MQSPIEHLVEWYESLPLDHRVDIAALVSFCPGFELPIMNLDTADIPDQFVKKVFSYKEGGYREFGAVVALRAFIQLMIIDKRSSREGWKETAATLAELGEIHDSETFRTKAGEARFRGEQWIVSCEKWTRLLTGPLSDFEVQKLTNPSSL